MKLINYFRSSASYRVRIALHLKGLASNYEAVHLTRGGGEQFSEAFRQINPAQLVPVLEDGDERISQSLAIIEYLDELYPQVPLLPRTTPANRAWVRQLALSIACDMHPLNNLRVLQYLTGPLRHNEHEKTQWVQHWIGLGFAALEQQLAGSPRRGAFCYGDAPSLADCCLVPQMFNAARFGVDLARYPTLRRIGDECELLEPFRKARPAAQPDAE